MIIKNPNTAKSFSLRDGRFLLDEMFDVSFKSPFTFCGIRIGQGFIIMLLSLVLFFSNGTAQVASRDSTLTEIESLYNSGQYLPAELEARRTMEEPDLSDSTKVQIEKWIAFSLIAQGKSSAAKERFVLLLKIDDAFELDPVLTSPKILSVFNDAKTKYLSQKKSPPPDTSNDVQQQSMELSPVSFRTIIFPGWEQIHQNRTGSGYIFLGAGAATLASGFIFEFLRADARKNYLRTLRTSEISSKYNTYNTYRKAEIYSFTAFALVYFASEFDVFAGSNVNIQSAYTIHGGNRLVFSVRF